MGVQIVKKNDANDLFQRAKVDDQNQKFTVDDLTKNYTCGQFLLRGSGFHLLRCFII